VDELTGRAKDVEMPLKPIRPVWNESRIRHRDYNDVFGSSMFFSHQDPAEREYEEAMEVYGKLSELLCIYQRRRADQSLRTEEQLRNASLWFVRGEERVVYDIIREMQLQSARRYLLTQTSPGLRIEPELVELTETFAIHMPWTNVSSEPAMMRSADMQFPPIERSTSSFTGKDNQVRDSDTGSMPRINE
jgi:hypothetical protein